MKTKLTLTIIGIIQLLQSVLYAGFAESSIDMMFNIGAEARQLAIMFQYALTPAFLMIGLMLLFSRNLAVEDAKKLLLAISLHTFLCLVPFTIWLLPHLQIWDLQILLLISSCLVWLFLLILNRKDKLIYSYSNYKT